MHRLRVEPPVGRPGFCAATAGGVFASSNSAAGWTLAVGGLVDQNVLSLALDPTAPLTLYAGTTSSSVAKTVSGGL